MNEDSQLPGLEWAGQWQAAVRAKNLAFHLIAVHRIPAAIASSPVANARAHHRDHHAAGWQPLAHPYAWLDWDEDTLEAVLEEAEAARWSARAVPPS